MPREYARGFGRMFRREYAVGQGGSDLPAFTNPYTNPFTAANNTPVEGYDPGAGAFARMGGSAGDAYVNASRCAVLVPSTRCVYLAPDCGRTDHYAQCLNTGAGTGNGSAGLLCVRASDQNNYVAVRALSATYQVFRVVGGTETALYTVNFGGEGVLPTNLDTIKLVAVGATVGFYSNGTLSDEGFVAYNASALNANTRCGFAPMGTAKTNLLDNWQSGY